MNYSEKNTFEKLKIKGAKMYKILCELGSVKKTLRHQPLTKTILKSQNWTNKYMKTDFYREIFTDESRLTFNGSNEWVLSNLDMTVAKTRQQGDGRVMLWAELVGQNSIGPYRVDEGVKLNRANFSDFIDETFFNR